MREIGLMEMTATVTAGRRYHLRHPEGTSVRDGGTLSSPTVGPVWEPAESGQHRLLLTADSSRPVSLVLIDLGPVR